MTEPNPVDAAIELLTSALEADNKEEADDAIRDVLDMLTGWTGNPNMRLWAAPRKENND